MVRQQVRNTCLKIQKKYGVHLAIKIAVTNIGQGDGFVTYPIYFYGFIEEDNESLILKKHNFEDLSLL